MVLANYLQNFDKCRYLQKSGMCCLPAEVWYLPTTCRTFTTVATCRNLTHTVYLQISDAPCLSTALQVPTKCCFLNVLLTLLSHWGLISDYCLGRSNFKFVVPVIVLLNYFEQSRPYRLRDFFLLFNFSTFTVYVCGPGSSVGIATDYGLDDPGSNPGVDEIFHPSRPALGPT